MSGRAKRNSAASTYSSSKKRRERELSPSSESQQESDSKASPRQKSNKSSEKTKANGSKKSKDAESSDEDKEKDDGEGDDDDDDEEEEYEVETIKKHRKIGSKIEYLVGWKGYPSSDDSWEPVEHLVGAVEILKRYQATHNLQPISKGGRVSDVSAKSASKRSAKADDQSDDSDDDEEEDQQKNRKRKRLSQGKIKSTIAPLRKNGTGGPTKADRDSVKNRKPVRSETEESESESVSDEHWHERHKKLSSWEDLIRSVRTIEKPSVEDSEGSEKEQGKTDDTINVCLLWKTGRVSWISNKIARDKLPQKMLDFYEAHLQFTTTEP
ncbi:hypothetical protein PGT21_017007 [Puccinia graminis f. sp. tritici]|uniref:Chromo domain-containing protein n=1 Tax=Puccinia graminis f. sp. tritici TaxID=56615 RepID=A0A5B0N322_PUCGR|nr:hypothetical protein PGT21_017007 [Puccinia graminis f. sp. tritici]KAA1127617.1 hypothetical protein PGTUg99_001160 [Puccinia graminis f. sp. tritici]